MRTLIIAAFLFFFGNYAFCQEWPNFKALISSTENPSEIKLAIYNGVPPFHIKIYDKLPEKGGVLINEYKKIQDTVYTIGGLNLTEYVLVYDSKLYLSGQYIKISNK